MDTFIPLDGLFVEETGVAGEGSGVVAGNGGVEVVGLEGLVVPVADDLAAVNDDGEEQAVVGVGAWAVLIGKDVVACLVADEVFVK